jgi:hypothetical protein
LFGSPGSSGIGEDVAARDDARRVLETIEGVLAALRADAAQDAAVQSLIESIEEDRAFLLAAAMQGHALARPPSRFRRPVTR